MSTSHGQKTCLIAIDVPKATNAELKTLLTGVDLVVSGISSWAGLESQRTLFQAAKEVGVKRVVPSDFSVVGFPGTNILRDQVSSVFFSVK